MEGRTELLAIRSTLPGVAGVAVSALLRGSAGGSDGAPGYTLHAPKRGKCGSFGISEGQRWRVGRRRSSWLYASQYQAWLGWRCKSLPSHLSVPTFRHQISMSGPSVALFSRRSVGRYYVKNWFTECQGGLTSREQRLSPASLLHPLFLPLISSPPSLPLASAWRTPLTLSAPLRGPNYIASKRVTHSIWIPTKSP